MSRYFFYFGGAKKLRRSLERIEQKINIIVPTQTEIVAKLNTVTAQIGKISAESSNTLQKVTELQEALANQQSVSPELQAAVDALAAQVQLVDDLIPDPVISNGSGAV